MNSGKYAQDVKYSFQTRVFNAIYQTHQFAIFLERLSYFIHVAAPCITFSSYRLTLCMTADAKRERHDDCRGSKPIITSWAT